MMNKELVTLIWWPHSGGRWLSRSILSNHSKIDQTTFVHPWLFNSTDTVLSLDITAQVHKARSLKELKQNLNALKESTDIGRLRGIENYFDLMRNISALPNESSNGILLGESCLGSPDPKPYDLKLVLKACPTMKFIHLVRNPVDSFNSFRTRHEMDSDPIRIAGSWSTLNASIRLFFDNHQEYKNQYHLVRYEDLLNNAREEIKRICDFLKIDFEDELLLETEKRWGKGTSIENSEYEKTLIQKIASNELREYNYL